MSKEALEAVKPNENKDLIAKIALTGNLADLSEAQRWEYYQAYCAHLNLDPITRPFDLLTTTERDGSKKTVLYGNASCATQIADQRDVTYGKPETEYNADFGVITIIAEARLPNGRTCYRRGVAAVQGLSGRALENAIKKAETQAHRRATLALCGIAMPDESEVEDVPGGQTAPILIPDEQPSDEQVRARFAAARSRYQPAPEDVGFDQEFYATRADAAQIDYGGLRMEIRDAANTIREKYGVKRDRVEKRISEIIGRTFENLAGIRDEECSEVFDRLSHWLADLKATTEE
jgi:hypothetical protein